MRARRILLVFICIGGFISGSIGPSLAVAELPFARSTVDPSPTLPAVAKALADLDGDGLLDPVVAGPGGEVFWYAAVDGLRRPLVASAAVANDGLEAVDLDGDADLDLVLANGVWLRNPSNVGDPLVDPWTTASYATGAGRDVAVADLDGDLDIDIVRRDATGDLQIYTQQAGLFSAAGSIAVPDGRGLALADLDSDGAVDIVIGDRWLANPGDPGGVWAEFLFSGAAAVELDYSVVVGDINRDGRPDVATAAREGPGISGRVVWWKTPESPRGGLFGANVVVDETESVHHSLQIGDFDLDGDLDLLTARSSAGLVSAFPPGVSLLENTGAGLGWAVQEIASEPSYQLRAGDVDGDDDLDFWGGDSIEGPLALWKNLGPVRGVVEFSRLSTENGDLELPNLGGQQQTASLILDVDLDGLNDFVITERTSSPSVVWYQRHALGWNRHVIDYDVLSIEAGGDYHDIDGDGDLDIAMGGDAVSNEIWWWENPYPDFDPSTPWLRHRIKDSGGNQQHDMIFGDFDGDGVDEFVYWNQQSRLYFAEIPPDPDSGAEWPAVQIFSSPLLSEGLDAADVDGDGVLDVVGAGRWFEYVSPTSFIAHVVDPTMNFTRAAAGQLIPGGRPELVFVIGDSSPSTGINGRGPLRWYEWNGTTWLSHEPLAFDTDHGHSLAIVDFNRDGHLDIFNAEMNLLGNSDAETRIFYGDSTGNFELQVVASGVDNHESKVGDLDGDGDLDILGKPFQTDAPGLNVWIHERVDPGLLPLTLWERFSVDPAQPWLAAYALPGDLDGDGLTDIASGGWWYRQPADYGDAWPRIPIGDPLKNVALLRDFDGDGDLDILGTEGMSQAPTHPGSTVMHWGRNDGAGNFTILDNVTPGNTTHQENAFVQGITTARFENGGPLQIGISWNFGEHGQSGIDFLTIPQNPSTEIWPLQTIHPFSEGEEIPVDDIDGDGDLDIFQGSGWLRNEEVGWTRITVTDRIGTNDPYDDPDRVRLSDLDGDGDLDAVIGLLFQTQSVPVDLVWLEHPADPTQEWPLHVIANEVWGGFSLDVADMDNDGDPDIVVGEHVGLTRLLIFENQENSATWVQHVIDPGGSGIDHHDGAQTIDFDGDGDLDIVSLGWTNQNVWLFENKALELEGIDDDQAPTPPKNLTGTVYSSSRIDLQWERSLDNLGIADYAVYRNGVLAGRTTQLSFEDTGLEPLTAYTHTIVGRDRAGNTSAESLPLTLTTVSFEGVPPTNPINIQLATGSTWIELSWGGSTDNRAVKGYRVYENGVLIAVLPASARSYFHSGLMPETQASYQITAIDAEENESDPEATTQIAMTGPAVTGLWGAWGFEDGAGTLIRDSSGNRNDGTLENAASLTANGYFDQAFEVEGSSGNVDLGGLDIYSAGFTVMMWINADDFDTHDGRLISKSTSDAEQDHYWMLSTISGPHLRFRLRTNGVTTTLIGNGDTLTAGTWIHAAATYDGASMRIYQDGVQVASTPKSGVIDLAPDVAAWIGANPGQIRQVFDGRIDDLKIFGRALSPTELQAEMAVPAPDPVPEPGGPLLLAVGVVGLLGLERLRCKSARY